MQVRKADERGKANFGWLKSYHSFSFGSYYDPEHMGVSALRVINDDEIAPGAGFDTHGHRDMEIITMVTKGVIEHKDSMGNVQQLTEGEYQLMSAGKGIFHSEYNGSKTDDLTLLQIWIEPNQKGGAPGYQQKPFGLEQGLTPVVTPDGRDGTLTIKQDASLYQLVLAGQTSASMTASSFRTYYVHLVSGELKIQGNDKSVVLNPGDGVSINDVTELSFSNEADEQLRALVFELP